MISPMLAAEAPADLAALPWPLYLSPKYDGVRILICPEHGPVTRDGNQPPNPALRSALAHPDLAGLDGELIVGDGRSGRLEDAKRVLRGDPGWEALDWRFVAFDDVLCGGRLFSDRRRRLRERATAARRALADRLVIAPADLHTRVGEAMGAYGVLVAGGWEGMILRSPVWPYKSGRASAHRGELVKVKPRRHPPTP